MTQVASWGTGSIPGHLELPHALILEGVQEVAPLLLPDRAASGPSFLVLHRIGARPQVPLLGFRTQLFSPTKTSCLPLSLVQQSPGISCSEKYPVMTMRLLCSRPECDCPQISRWPCEALLGLGLAPGGSHPLSSWTQRLGLLFSSSNLPAACGSPCL